MAVLGIFARVTSYSSEYENKWEQNYQLTPHDIWSFVKIPQVLFNRARNFQHRISKYTSFILSHSTKYCCAIRCFNFPMLKVWKIKLKLRFIFQCTRVPQRKHHAKNQIKSFYMRKIIFDDHKAGDGYTKLSQRFRVVLLRCIIEKCNESQTGQNNCSRGGKWKILRKC